MAVIGRLARALLPGVRRVHAQVARHAGEWEEANRRALDATGPLWVVLGDSTAQGIGAPSRDEGYVGQLLRGLEDGAGRPWRVVNLSRSGARAADVLDRQLPALGALVAPPDLVTCAIGANDIVRRTPLPLLVERLRAILARLPERAVIATLPQGLSREPTDVVNRVIREEAPGAGLVVADVWARTGPPWHGKLAADRFHPGPLGYAEWAAAFADVLDQALPTPPAQAEGPPERLGRAEPT